MKQQQKNNSFSTDSLEARIAILENKLAVKDSVIADKDSVIADKDSTINKLTIDLDAAKFQNEQLLRMIFGPKRERFECIHPTSPILGQKIFIDKLWQQIFEAR